MGSQQFSGDFVGKMMVKMWYESTGVRQWRGVLDGK